MKRIHPLFLLSFATLSPLCDAADAFDDAVPVAVVEQILGSTMGGQTQLYADIVDGFPAFELPRGMEVLASIDQGFQQRVILTTRFDHQAASALAYGALLDAGWQLVPEAGNPQPRSGFIDPNQPLSPTQLCHDEHGVMNVSTAGGVRLTYVHLSRNVAAPGSGQPVMDCATGEMRYPGQGSSSLTVSGTRIVEQVSFRTGFDLQAQMPRLVLPETDGMRSIGGYGGGGGSGNEWEVRAQLGGSWDIERVFDHFVEQIEAQAWQRDTATVGEQMASGSWTKTAEDGAELLGSLTVLMAGDSSFDLRFRLLRKGGADSALGIQGGPAGTGLIMRGTPFGVSEIVRERR